MELLLSAVSDPGGHNPVSSLNCFIIKASQSWLEFDVVVVTSWIFDKMKTRKYSGWFWPIKDVGENH